MRGAVLDYVRWQRARRAAIAAGTPQPEVPALVPLSINLDLTTACNYACDHCIDWEILNSKVKHADDELRSALARMADHGLRSVILIGGGEPTLYPGFGEFVRFLKQLRLQVAVVSNGSRNEKIHEIAEAFDEHDWVRLSLDSGANATFQRMHNPSRKNLTLDEICAWIAKIKQKNPKPRLGFSFVITWRGGQRDDVKVVENIGEIELATRRARDAGFDYISFKPFLERSASGSEVMDPSHAEAALLDVQRRIRAAVDRAKDLERPGFRVLESTNLRVLMQGNWRDYTRQPRTCHMQALRQVLTPLGLYNCPAHRGVEKARIAGKDAYADAAKARATAGQTAAILDRFDAGHECAQVTCLYNSANWWLEDLIHAPGEPAVDAAEAQDWFL
jgi:sulfatase maturation enzyme AslB (radical SAM superfamily)